VRPRTGITEVAIDEGKRNSFRKMQVTITDTAGFANRV
jgi:hypothetical protein